MILGRRSLAAALLAASAVMVPGAAAADDSGATARECAKDHWVGSWAAAPSDGSGVNFVRPLAAQTVRMIVNPTLSGETARVRLSNRYGATAAHLSSATVGVRASGAAIVPGTLRRLTFGGSRAVDLAAGADVRSDSIELPVTAGQDLVVSLHVPGVVLQPTQHFVTNQTNYLSVPGTGDHTAATGGGAFLLRTATVFSNGWFFLSGVDVRARRSTSAVVAFGDSITDGYQGGPMPFAEGSAGRDANARYPDFLARRLRAESGREVAVLNSGISGNRVLTDAQPPFPYGVSGLRRFEADATSLPGVTDVVILEGINDLGGDETLTADALIAGLRKLVDDAQAAGLHVHLGTILPAFGASGGHGSAHTEERRQAVNEWIRTSGVADSVVDFDAAVRDPAQPSRLLPEYDSGDRLHPSSAGYAAMAGAVNLRALKGAGC